MTIGKKLGITNAQVIHTCNAHAVYPIHIDPIGEVYSCVSGRELEFHSIYLGFKELFRVEVNEYELLDIVLDIIFALLKSTVYRRKYSNVDKVKKVSKWMEYAYSSVFDMHLRAQIHKIIDLIWGSATHDRHRKETKNQK